jgi:hypothetical protein
VLKLPYIKFILSYLNKINKKILFFIVNKILFTIKVVNQQEILLSSLMGSNNTKYNKGSSETICDITYNFEEYSTLIPEHKNKINRNFLE